MPKTKQDKSGHKPANHENNLPKLLRTYDNIRQRQNGVGVLRNTQGLKALTTLSELATKYGLILPGQTEADTENAAVANEQTINTMSKMSKDKTFGNNIPEMSNFRLNNTYGMLNIYETSAWSEDNVKKHPTIKSVVKEGDSIAQQNFWRKRSLGVEFENRDHILPPGTYEEWDATLLRRANGGRDAERFVRETQKKKIYYTGTHYDSFLRIR